MKFCTHCHWNRNQFKKVLKLKSTGLNYLKKNQFLYSLLKITMTDFYQLFGQRMNFISYIVSDMNQIQNNIGTVKRSLDQYLKKYRCKMLILFNIK